MFVSATAHADRVHALDRLVNLPVNEVDDLSSVANGTIREQKDVAA